MKHLLSCLIFSLAILPLFAQTKIDNSPTEAHIEIPGTKFLIIKPDASFEISTNFVGLQSENLEAALNLTDLPLSYEKVGEMFTRNLPPKNGELVLDEQLLMNGYQARLIKTDVIHKSALEKLENPDAPGKPVINWLLLYGDAEMAITIAGTYPKEQDEVLSAKFEACLRSFIYVKDKEVDPMDGLSFRVDVSDTPLQFATTLMQTGAVFNTDGKFPTEAKGAPNYMVRVLPFAIEAEKQKEHAIRRVKNLMDEDTEIEAVNPIQLAGLKGFEVIGYEQREDGKRVLEYSVSLFDEARHFTINGFAEPEPEHLALFRKISQTFQVKE